MYEHRTEPLLAFPRFLHRLVRHGLVAAAVICGSLGVGVAGYHFLERLPWLDSLLNASMILGGMGPVDTLRTAAGKFFASCYALFSGVVFLVVAGILIAPVAHRMIHHFHRERKS